MNCYWWAPLKEEVVDLELHLQEDATGIRLKGESCRKCQRRGGGGYLIILPLAM